MCLSKIGRSCCIPHTTVARKVVCQVSINCRHIGMSNPTTKQQRSQLWLHNHCSPGPAPSHCDSALVKPASCHMPFLDHHLNQDWQHSWDLDTFTASGSPDAPLRSSFFVSFSCHSSADRDGSLGRAELIAVLPRPTKRPNSCV